VSKPQVAKNYTYDESIVIGDGITDFNLARTATVVFARDMLAQYCDTENRGYIKWRDFRDIRQALQARWQLP
jgi:2-hydroxy-3-keto-5-methylthiopentenyl-1-phosphate phosphatase